MCGIFGHIGKRESSSICLEGLYRLEYRGYDSAGIAGFSDGAIISRKEVGKVAALGGSLDLSPMNLQMAIAHTRWATHGAPSQRNAHPIHDEKESLAIVHNGIIENHAAIRKMLEGKGVTFKTDTDTEVIAQLISHFYEGDILKAFQKAIAQLQGFWGIALIHKDYPETIFASARENPLAIATDSAHGDALISSDVNAFGRNNLDILFLKNNEIAAVTKDQIALYTPELTPATKTTVKIDTRLSKISKDGYEHFMIKEIFEQPETIHATFAGRIDHEKASAKLDELKLTAEELLEVDRIVLIACGTSWHAATIAAGLLEQFAKIPATAEIASEFRYKNPVINEKTLVIAISQSGETLDTIAALRLAKEKGAKVIGLCNVANSTLTRETSSCLSLNAGPEISVCSTKAFTSQITLLLLLTLYIGRIRELSREDGLALIEQIEKLPLLAKRVLAGHKQIEEMANKYGSFTDFFFLGRHYMHVTSLESALKLKEISYLNATGYPAGEMKHGPIALVCESLLTIGMCGNIHTLEKTVSNLTEIKARGGPILLFAPESTKQHLTTCDDAIFLPDTGDESSCIIYSIATQLFAYYIAKNRGLDIDKPRNLAKSVTVE